jgi:hypothetical protein
MLFFWNCVAFACTSQNFHGGGATVCVNRIADNCAQAFAFEARSVVISHLPVTNCEAQDDINNNSNMATYLLKVPLA